MRTAMAVPRRKFLRLALGAAAVPAILPAARGQAYPSRPVRLIVGFGPAGLSDLAARLIGPWLSERLGRQFVIENRPGAGGNLATEAVVRAAPDGYTLLLAQASDAINATLYEKLNFVFVRDITPVAGLIVVPNVLVVHPSVPANTIPELVAYAKANPGKLNMGSVGNGSVPHVAGELFKMMSDINMVHVPYRGAAPALTDLLAGQVHVFFGSPPSTIEYIRAGRLRALAITSAMRSAALPGLPALAEFVPGYETSFWAGIGAPKNTPAEVVDTLNKEINAGLATPTIKAHLADLGGAEMPMTPSAFGKFITDETEKWGKVVKFAGIKVE